MIILRKSKGSSPGRFQRGVQDIFYCIGSSMESTPNVFSYVHQQVFRMPDLRRQMASKNNNKNIYVL